MNETPTPQIGPLSSRDSDEPVKRVRKRRHVESYGYFHKDLMLGERVVGATLEEIRQKYVEHTGRHALE